MEYFVLQESFDTGKVLGTWNRTWKCIQRVRFTWYIVLIVYRVNAFSSFISCFLSMYPTKHILDTSIFVITSDLINTFLLKCKLTTHPHHLVEFFFFLFILFFHRKLLLDAKRWVFIVTKRWAYFFGKYETDIIFNAIKSTPRILT